MILRNPTESTVSITLDGKTYLVEPSGSTENLPREIAERWYKVHGFLVKEETDEVEEVVEAEVGAPVQEIELENVEVDRVSEVKESPVAPKAPARGKGLIARLKAAAKGKK